MREKQWWQIWKRRTPTPTRATGGEVRPRIPNMFKGAELNQTTLAWLLKERGHTNLSGVESAIWEPFVARLVGDPDDPEKVYVTVSTFPGRRNYDTGSSLLGFWAVGMLAPAVAAVWSSRVDPEWFEDFSVVVGMPAKGIYHDGNYRIEIRSPRYRGGALARNVP